MSNEVNKQKKYSVNKHALQPKEFKPIYFRAEECDAQLAKSL